MVICITGSKIFNTGRYRICIITSSKKFVLTSYKENKNIFRKLIIERETGFLFKYRLYIFFKTIKVEFFCGFLLIIFSLQLSYY